jgi:type IV pilus assembly protein PilW
MNRVAMKPYVSARAGRARGLSLIELMIAIVIGMVIMAFLLALYINVTRSNNEMARMNRQIENGRFAIQLVQSDLAHAGFWGDYIPLFEDRNIASPSDVPTLVPDPCEASGTWDAVDRNNLLGIPVQDSVGTCGVVSNLQANTDVLVVRHAEPVLPAQGNACPAGEVCFQASQCANEINFVPSRRYLLGTENDVGANGFELETKDCTDGAVGAPTVPTSTVRRLISNIYYVRNDFTLMRSEYLNGVQQAAQPLIEGIEAMRVEYGIDNVGGNGAPVSYTGAINRGDGVPDVFVSCAPCNANQLVNAVAVRVHVLARSLEATPGYTSTKTYRLGNAAPLTFSDGIKRHVFTTTVRLVNPSGRRETP